MRAPSRSQLLREEPYVHALGALSGNVPVHLLGVLPEYRTIGIYPLLICELYKLVREKTTYKRVEFSWVLEDNYAINQTVERMGALHYQTYRIYQRALL